MVVVGPFAALNYPFELAVDDPDLAAYLAHLMAALMGGKGLAHRIEITGPGATAIVVDGTTIAADVAPNQLLSQLVGHLNLHAVAATGDHLLLHSGAVASGGRAVLLPAPMESGKTTLTAGLVMRGLDYVTDETVAIRPNTGTILPFPKPLSVDQGSWDVLAELRPPVAPGIEPLHAFQWQVAADDIRPGAVAGPCRPSLVVAPHYVRGETTKLEPMTRAEAVLLLAQNSFNFRDRGRQLLPLVGQVVTECECFRLLVGDLDAACDEILQLMAAQPAVAV